MSHPVKMKIMKTKNVNGLNNTITNLDGLVFLNDLEMIYHLEGFDGIIEMVKKRFPAESLIQMSTDIEDTNRTIFKIKRVIVAKLYPEIVVFENGNKNSGTIIRSFKLPYVDIPFQVDIYGVSGFENKN